MPKISVIMGVYNAEKRKNNLKKAIDSILNQTYNDFEFIICDDGSQDNTLKILAQIINNDKRVKIIKNEKNKGLTFTLNKCLNVAKGEYIARMDYDDISDITRFEKQVKILDNNIDISIVATCANIIDDNGKWSERKYNEYIVKKDFLFNNPVMHPTVMVRKKVFFDVGGYRDNKYTLRVEDYDFFMRTYAKGYKIYTIQQNLLNYREDKDSFKKRKYKYRLNEAIVRYNGYKALKLMPLGLVFVIKPLVIGLIPIGLIKRVHMKKNR